MQAAFLGAPVQAKYRVSTTYSFQKPILLGQRRDPVSGLELAYSQPLSPPSFHPGDD